MSLAPPIPLIPTTPDERRAYEAFYHEHEEASVPQSFEQDTVADEVGDIIPVIAEHLWAARDICCYWVPGDNQTYLAPDVLVGERPEPQQQPGVRSYRLWEHGPLRLVLEIASESSRAYDRSEKLARYAIALRPTEYIYFDPENGDLRLWRWSGRSYQPVGPNAQGWFWSQETGLWFTVEGKRIRLRDAEGTPLRNYQEEVDYRRQEQTRAASEAARAASETARATEAEARVAALEAELAALRSADRDRRPPEAES